MHLRPGRPAARSNEPPLSARRACGQVACVSAVLWSFSELAAALGQRAAAGPDVAGICIDSRRIAPGELFVALAGDPGPRFSATSRSNRDGHDFIADAVAKGAAAVLASRPGDYAVPALVVKDTLDGLWQLGRAARRRLRGAVVAVTGSSGKTTAKSFLAAALDAFATPGSLNNHIGVPLSLALAPPEAPAAVLEIGTNHPGEIGPLSQLAAPDVAVLLNVQPAHIGHFGSLAAIAQEKAAIAEGLGSHGTLVRAASAMVDHPARTIVFGNADEAADVRLLGVTEGADGAGGSERAVAELATPSGRTTAPVPGGGRHRAESVAAAAAVLLALDLPLANLARLSTLTVPQGRGNTFLAGGVRIVDESYNANPTSMTATLRAFAAAPPPGGARRFAVLGDMLELGADSARYHEALAADCHGLSGLVCVGKRMGALYAALPPAQRLGHVEAADAALAERCAELLRPGDSVLVKGSNSVFWANGFVAALAAALRPNGTEAYDAADA